MSFIKFGKCLVSISLNIFSAPLSSCSLSWTPVGYVRSFQLSHSLCSFYFLSFYSLFFRLDTFCWSVFKFTDLLLWSPLLVRTKPTLASRAVGVLYCLRDSAKKEAPPWYQSLRCHPSYVKRVFVFSKLDYLIPLLNGSSLPFQVSVNTCLEFLVLLALTFLPLLLWTHPRFQAGPSSLHRAVCPCVLHVCPLSSLHLDSLPLDHSLLTTCPSIKGQPKRILVYPICYLVYSYLLCTYRVPGYGEQDKPSPCSYPVAEFGIGR